MSTTQAGVEGVAVTAATIRRAIEIPVRGNGGGAITMTVNITGTVYGAVVRSRRHGAAVQGDVELDVNIAINVSRDYGTTAGLEGIGCGPGVIVTGAAIEDHAVQGQAEVCCVDRARSGRTGVMTAGTVSATVHCGIPVGDRHGVGTGYIAAGADAVTVAVDVGADVRRVVARGHARCSQQTGSINKDIFEGRGVVQPAVAVIMGVALMTIAAGKVVFDVVFAAGVLFVTGVGLVEIRTTGQVVVARRMGTVDGITGRVRTAAGIVFGREAVTFVTTDRV